MGRASDPRTPGEPEAGVDTAGIAAVVRARLFDDQAPYRIGRYTVQERLGAGGMGVVYAADDPELGRRVAVKLVYAGADDHGRLAREAQVMARLNHPNVAQVYEVGHHGDATFVAMEYVRGQTLRVWALGDRSARLRRAVLIQAGRGLAAAHAAGLIHRDFKPDNVIVGDDGRVRVLDFGLARALSDDARDLVQGPSGPSHTTNEAATQTPRSTAAGAGTPAYMAPEQWRGETIDARADIYAFCVTAWEILGGRRPFAEASFDQLRLGTGRRRTVEPARAVPRGVQRVLRRGLANDRDARPADIDAVLVELARDPVVARRRVAVLAVGGATVVGAVGWPYATGLRRDRACIAQGEAIAQVWNAARADAVGASFTATGLRYAPDAFARVRTRLDAYAGQWASARNAACRADVRTTVPAAITCLDDGRTHLRVLTDTLAVADPVAVQLAVSSVIGLVDPADCVDPRSVAQRQAVALPRSADERRRALQVAVMRQTGAYEASLAAAEALVADLVRSGSRGTPGARLAVGGALRDLGRFAEARVALETAYFEAGAMGDDFTAMRAAIALVDTVGFRLAERERGQAWVRTARVYVERLDLLDAPDGAALQANVGVLLKDAGEAGASVAAHRRALAIYTNHFGESHPAVASSSFALGVALADRGDVDEGIAAMRRAIEIDEAALGPEHPVLANVLNSLGIWEGNQGDYEAAMATLQRASSIDEGARGTDHESYASTLISIANIDARFGRNQEALDGYRRALAIVEAAFEPDHPRVGAALAALARGYSAAGDDDGALEYYRRALQIQERALGPDDANLAPILGNMGILLLNSDAAGSTAAGLQLLGRTERILSARYGADNEDRAVLLAAMGSAQTSDGHPREALALLQEALSIMEHAGTAADRRADCEFELARALYELGEDRDRALALARRAADSWRPIGDPRAEWVGYAEELIAALLAAGAKP